MMCAPSRIRAAEYVLAGVLAAVAALAQQPAPAESGANLPARPLGSEDLVSINVYGAPELTRSVRVSAEGFLRLPMLDRPVQVAGAMPAQVEQRIAAALVEEHVLIDPAVTVTIAEYHSRPISVAGAVRQPLTFPVYGKITLLEALARAQGLSAEAGGEILVTRPRLSSGEPPSGEMPSGEPAPVERVPVKGLIDAADPALNLTLAGGEEIRVPQLGRIFVVGNVRRPGGFPAGDGSGLTVLKAVALAEGLAPFSTKQAYIYRRPERSPPAAGRLESAPPQEILVELRKIMDRKSPDVALGPDDILYIPDSRKARNTANALEKVLGFVAGTASGALILSVTR
jgi:polysaccharide export outer membrane protein